MNLENVRRGGGDDEFLIHPSTPISIYILNHYKFIGDGELILEEETFEKFGYYPSDVWGQPILVACDECGAISTITKRHNHRLCRVCSQIKYSQLKDKEWLFNQYWVKKLPLSQIARIVGCSTQSVANALHRLGITVRTYSESEGGELNYNYGKEMSEEQREKISTNHADVSGENNPNWNGGISYFPYCTKFNNTLKEEVRDKFGRKCFLCPKTEEEEGRKLSVHHVDYNKEQGCNGVRWLLVPLCRSCNSKVNNNRDYWQDFITEKLRQEGYI